ncbi:MAG: AAA family ATPase [candidate division Zixibacteria bacterium]|nr:AAA family ATPase [candidate division Zixibacteria bacterium]
MSKPLDKVELCNFRGASEPFELAFDRTKDLTLLFGENGSGKSTILDAIDVVCNGSTGGLEDMSVGRGPAQYLKTLGAKVGTLRATVHSDSESWCATLDSSTVEVAGPDERPSVRILRRKKILSLVTAQPNERYKELKSFIDTVVVEQSENNLLSELKGIDKQREKLEIAQKSKGEELEKLWESEERPGPSVSALGWASEKAKESITALQSQQTGLESVIDAMDSAIADCNNYMKHRSSVDSLSLKLKSVEHTIKTASDANTTTTVLLAKSLREAKAYIDADTKLDKCPTCLRKIVRDELILIVDKQLEELKALTALIDKKAEIARQSDAALSNAYTAAKELTNSMQHFHQTSESTSLPDIKALNISWPDWSKTPVDCSLLLPVGKKLETVRAQLKTKQENLGRDINQHNLITQPYDGFCESIKKLDFLNHIRSRLSQAHKIIHDMRVAFVQNILDDITSEANRLFGILHPRENIGLSKLRMDEKKRSSVEQSGSFGDHTNVLPQTVFSESHLDTLGFCVWLALAKRKNPKETILLIDDVFTSVDNLHVGRIVGLLIAEAPNFLQVFVATHFRLWWDRYQNAQGVERIKLGRWTVGNGICVQNSPLQHRQLRDMSKADFLNRQATASKAGVLLECLLDQLALLYGMHVPRKQDNLYTLGELVDASRKLFTKRNLSVEINKNWNRDGQTEDFQSTSAGAAFDRLEEVSFARNQVGCHYSVHGMEIPDNEIREFGLATADLIEAMVCPNCGQLARVINKEGTARRCTCRKQAARMTPTSI